MNAADDPQFYNKHNNTARIINGPLSEEHKEKIRKGCLRYNIEADYFLKQLERK